MKMPHCLPSLRFVRRFPAHQDDDQEHTPGACLGLPPSSALHPVSLVIIATIGPCEPSNCYAGAMGWRQSWQIVQQPPGGFRLNHASYSRGGPAFAPVPRRHVAAAPPPCQPNQLHAGSGLPYRSPLRGAALAGRHHLNPKRGRGHKPRPPSTGAPSAACRPKSPPAIRPPHAAW
jgi:hypothetical protein